MNTKIFLGWFEHICSSEKNLWTFNICWFFKILGRKLKTLKIKANLVFFEFRKKNCLWVQISSDLGWNTQILFLKTFRIFWSCKKKQICYDYCHIWPQIHTCINSKRSNFTKDSKVNVRFKSIWQEMFIIQNISKT